MFLPRISIDQRCVDESISCKSTFCMPPKGAFVRFLYRNAGPVIDSKQLPPLGHVESVAGMVCEKSCVRLRSSTRNVAATPTGLSPVDDGLWNCPYSSNVDGVLPERSTFEYGLLPRMISNGSGLFEARIEATPSGLTRPFPV